MPTWQVILLGLIEGVTEFLPVSSTGHLLLTEHFLDVCTPGRTFEVLIQLGAILAILSVYAVKLTRIAVALPSDGGARRFVIGILLAFLPAAVVGASAHDFIKSILFETPVLIASMLVIGGVILLIVDRIQFDVHYTDVMEYTPGLCFKIGLFQCLALIPGVSRSGATIVGAMMMGTDKRSAAEFTFFLAMPTMVGAFAFELYKNGSILQPSDIANIALGFVTAFIAAVFVARHLLNYVSRYGFALFGWWRIVVGSAALAAMFLLGDTAGCPAPEAVTL
ncbi:MAG: undecaprenyl-diphosphate phosphatase [Hyphomicrobium sp.]|nr:undecaprenyl-diphosphate phosphatase [Hyphomicrobium sp.]